MSVHAKNATIVGDVELGKNVSVLYNAVIRGDLAPIKIGNNSNVQDNCVIHVSPNAPCVIGENVTIGHGAVVHSALVSNRVIIGMNATVLSGAVIEEDCIIAAGALVKQNQKIPSGTLWVGVPAKQARELTNEDKAHIIKNAEEYTV